MPTATALVAQCAALCASLNCQSYAQMVAGPVPIGFGCCNQIQGTVQFNFSIWNFNPAHVDYGLVPSIVAAGQQAQFRYVANNNRVLLGMLVQQTRWGTASCASERFVAIDDTCQSTAFSSTPYGSDPTFVSSSPLYVPGLNASNFYLPSEISPYNIPYGFFPDKPGGTTFSVFFDINLSQQRVAAVLQYLQAGFYIDGSTHTLTASMVLYNQVEHLFSSFQVVFTFMDAGELLASSRVDIVDAEPYLTNQDFVRAALELCFVLMWAYNVVDVCVDSVLAARAGRLRAYLSRWSIDILNIAFNGVEILFWLILAFRHELQLDIPARIPALISFVSPSRFLQLDHVGIAKVEDTITMVQNLNLLNVLYDMTHGVNLLLFIARILKLSHFQPRLGVITRTLLQAVKDLSHFMFVFAFMYSVCSCLAYLVFGGLITQFSSIGHSFQITWNMVLFQDSNYMDNFYFLQTPMNYPGMIYYWVFSLIMTIMLVQFVTAIIVDSFAALKAASARISTVPEELRTLSEAFFSKGAAEMLEPVPEKEALVLLSRLARDAKQGSAPGRPDAPLQRRATTRELQRALQELEEEEAERAEVASSGELPQGVVRHLVLPVTLENGAEVLVSEEEAVAAVEGQMLKVGTSMPGTTSSPEMQQERIRLLVRQCLEVSGVPRYVNAEGEEVKVGVDGQVLDPTLKITGMSQAMLVRVETLESSIETRFQQLHDTVSLVKSGHPVRQ